MYKDEVEAAKRKHTKMEDSTQSLSMAIVNRLDRGRMLQNEKDENLASGFKTGRGCKSLC